MFYLHLIALTSSRLSSLYSNQDNNIEGHYIVVLKESNGLTASTNHINRVKNLLNKDSKHKGSVKHEYDMKGFKGYSASLSEDTLKHIRGLDEVDFVEHDGIATLNKKIQDIKNNHQMEFETTKEFERQKYGPWGLARLSSKFKLKKKDGINYIYQSNNSRNVTIYLIDTGINVNHTEFEGRATMGFNIINYEKSEDLNGHGSHCAGIIGSRAYGVFKKARIIGVKVCDGNGYCNTSDIIKGIEFVIHDLIKRKKLGYERDFVGSISLGVPYSRAINMAVESAIAHFGVHFAIAAGNESFNACYRSPSSVNTAITVGATYRNDTIAKFSNTGECVNIFAPGVDILSAWKGSNDATKSISGTSMAAPHVAGLVAYLLSLQPNDKSVITPSDMLAFLMKNAQKGKLDNVPTDTKNLLAYNLVN